MKSDFVFFLCINAVNQQGQHYITTAHPQYIQQYPTGTKIILPNASVATISQQVSLK
jgi:hypothetical protein